MKITKHAPKRTPVPNSVPDVFILESLSFKDEEAQLYEGRILANVLSMCGKKPKYYYFRTEEELVELTTMFRNSNYRYLHLSCHGSDWHLHTTLGAITYERFGEIIGDSLNNKRLFLSACSAGKEAFAKEIVKQSPTIHSIAAPTDDILFRHAIALWTALYVRAFSVDRDGMSSKELRSALTQICALFEIRFYLKWRIKTNGGGWKHTIIKKLLPADEGETE